MPSELLSTREGRALVLTISDPATRNALSPQVYTAAVEALNMAEGAADIACVIFTGAGAHFSAGGDLQRIRGLRAQGPQAQADSMALFHTLIESLRAFPKPVIAAVEGHAAGGGMSLALACDLIVAADDARFSMAYGRVGLSPDGAGTWHLARALPRALALEILWLGGTVDAARLQALGVVNRLTHKGGARLEAIALAEQLAQRAANALASAKELVGRAPQAALGPHLADEQRHFIQNLFHDNGAEGLQAFFEKRPPAFR